MYFQLGSVMAAGLIFSTAPIVAETLKVRDITDQQEISERAGDFESDLNQLGIKAKLNCDLLIGSKGETNDESVGAICDMSISGKKPTSIMLCNDTMIGKLTIKAYGFSMDKKELAAFTEMNCRPGG
ncbi:hypothetical protein KXR64_18770 [Brucella intermedia]|uniref:hypothetical protein n=1 Tax=Brucella TaxID=234 RepID=UPI00094616AB|nr:hypothetical protein [Brucella intermedia]